MTPNTQTLILDLLTAELDADPESRHLNAWIKTGSGEAFDEVPEEHIEELYVQFLCDAIKEIENEPVN